MAIRRTWLPTSLRGYRPSLTLVGSAWSMFGVAALAAVLYGPALRFGFFNDDPTGHLAWMESRTWLELFATSSGHTFYRPIGFVLWKALIALVGGHQAPVLHALSILVHAADAALVWQMARRLSGRAAYAWFVALAFAAFPLSYEAVTYVAALCHPLLTFFALLTLLLFDRARATGRRRYDAAAGVCLVLGLLTHENGMVIPGLLLVWHWVQRPPRALREVWRNPAWLYGVPAMLFGALWLHIPRETLGGPASLADLAQNALHVSQIPVYPLLPFLRTDGGTGLALLAAGCLLALLLLAYLARAVRVWVFGLAWFVAGALPAVLFLEPSYLVGGARLFYLCALGACLLWGLVILALERLVQKPRLGRAALEIACVLAVLAPSLHFIVCETDVMAEASRAAQGMAVVANLAPPEKDIVLVNVPTFFTSCATCTEGCATPFPLTSPGGVVIPPYANAADFVRMNGGPQRTVRTVRYPGYEPDWYPHGEEVSAVVLRDLVAMQQVYVFDLPSERYYDLSGAWRAYQTGTPDPAVPERFLLPLLAPLELPSDEELAGCARVDVQYAEALTLLGVRAEPDAVEVGGTLALELFWRAGAEPAPDLRVHVILRDRFGNAYLEDTFQPVAGLPTGAWEPGATYRTRRLLVIPEQAATGETQVQVQVLAGEALPATQGGREVGIEPIAAAVLVGRPSLVSPEAAQPTQPRAARLGGNIALLGYDLPSDQVRAGEQLMLTLYWRALTQLESNYTVFIHATDEQGRLVAQQDCEPNMGQFPTSGWPLDRVVLDAHALDLPADLATGRYKLLVGMYAWPSLERLGVSEDGVADSDVIELATLAIVP
ncbi:MAG: hypothetical protein ACYC4R_06235 [Anaerolineae bacterium]